MFAEPATHPGCLTVVSPDGTETVQPAENFPDWLKFARGRDGSSVPVVLIARVRTGGGYTLRSYGADGRLLSVTTSPDGEPIRPADETSGWF